MNYELGIKNYELRINSRKILTALAEISGGIEKMMDITIAIDKLDKIGLGKVKEEGQFYNGYQNGTFTYYDPTGKSILKKHFYYGLLINVSK